MASILALGILLGAVTPIAFFSVPASAHVCTQAAEVRVGQRFTLNVGVAAEDKPAVAVDIQVPAGLEVHDQLGFGGWVGTRAGNVVSFTGATIEPYQCAYFTFQATADKKGAYAAEITTTAPDGTRTVYRSRNPYSPVPAMMIYAGLDKPNPEDFTGAGSGSGGAGLWKAVAVAVGLGAGAVVIAVRLNGRRDGRRPDQV